jgi:enamine deaminase RidA (YjgF/YER057c/UK114 family)
MTKTRNNHEDIYGAGPTYIRAIRAGNTLYISGCTARHSNAEGGPVMEQLRVVLDRIIGIVRAEGGAPSDIVAMTTYMTDMRELWPIEGEQVEIWTELFQGEWPTNSYVEVSALAEPGLDVEITATAVLG